MKILQISATVALLMSSVSLTYAQLVTSTNLTPQQLVQNVLVGTGVSTSNIVYTGSPTAIGSFDGSNCNVGLGSGIILTTGTVLNSSQFGFQEGPFGPNDNGGSGVDNGQPGDPLLANITGIPSFNAARLEFDFQPQSDSIKFNFVFGSEEYLEFVNAGVNDAFGFFITGPNPTGGNYTNENIAIIPGTNLPVTIDNLNANSNSTYFIDNGDGMSPPFNTSGTYIQYDGMTTVLTAKAEVVCNQNYHIIIVISDIGDGVFDSGVFLEAGSFTSPGIDISSQLTFQGNPGNDSTLIEGCGSADIWFVRSDSIPFQQTISLSYSGSATNGVDFNLLPNQITFPAGEDSVAMNIQAFFDNLSEPVEELIITTNVPSNCGTAITDTLHLYIQNVDELEVQVANDTVPCPNDPVTLTAITSNGTPGYTYLWSNGATTPQITVSPLTTTTYNVTVTDTCGQTATTSATVVVPTFNPIKVLASSDVTIHCPGEQVTLTASSSGGGANHVLTWSNNASGSSIDVSVNFSTQFVVTVTDACGNTDTDTVNVYLNEIPMQSVISEDVSICPGDSVNLIVIPSGGVGNDYDFIWSNGETDSSIWVTPTQTTEFVVGISDDCGVIKIWDTVTVTVIGINAQFVATGLLEENSDVHFNNLSAGADTYFWDLGNGETSTNVHPTTSYENPANYEITLYAYNNLGCMDSFTQVIAISPEFMFYAPNAFTPDGDEFNQLWQVSVIGHDPYDFDLFIYDRWGELIWENHDATIGWDGTYNGRIVQTGSYVWKAIVKLPHIDERRVFHGTVHLLK